MEQRRRSGSSGKLAPTRGWRSKAQNHGTLLAMFVGVPLTIGLGACGKSSAPPPPPPPPPPKVMARPAPDMVAPPPATAAYFAKVIAPQSLTASQTGEADVYVGTSAYIKNRASVPSAATASKTVELARGLKQSAEVTLAGGAFEIAPIVPSRDKPNCYALGEDGSQFPFAITPKKNATSGSYQINAHVLLYPQRDCVGTPSSQPSEPATVTVHVKSGARKNWNQLAAITWTEFKKFWGALVALVFALVLFLIRKRLAKWFGFKSKE